MTIKMLVNKSITILLLGDSIVSRFANYLSINHLSQWFPLPDTVLTVIDGTNFGTWAKGGIVLSNGSASTGTDYALTDYEVNFCGSYYEILSGELSILLVVEFAELRINGAQALVIRGCSKVAVQSERRLFLFHGEDEGILVVHVRTGLPFHQVVADLEIRHSPLDGLHLFSFLDLMIKTGKSPSQLIDYLYSKVGPHYFKRIDLEFPEDEREAIISRVKNNPPAAIDGIKVIKVDSFDGFRFALADGTWLLIRFSGTEPVLRLYTESDSPARVEKLLERGREIARV